MHLRILSAWMVLSCSVSVALAQDLTPMRPAPGLMVKGFANGNAPKPMMTKDRIVVRFEIGRAHV